MARTAAAQVDIYEVASHLWETADELRANSHLKAAEYSIPVLGLIFLRFADSRFTEAEADLAGRRSGRRTIGKADYQSRGILYLPDQARFGQLLDDRFKVRSRSGDLRDRDPHPVPVPGVPSPGAHPGAGEVQVIFDAGRLRREASTCRRWSRRLRIPRARLSVSMPHLAW